MAVLITKSELAQELGVSRSRVSQLIARGLPVEAGDKVNLELACYWVLDHVSPAAELNTENSHCRWNARQIVSLMERARQRGDTSEYGGPDAA
jgi:hypothetical protein